MSVALPAGLARGVCVLALPVSISGNVGEVGAGARPEESRPPCAWPAPPEPQLPGDGGGRPSRSTSSTPRPGAGCVSDDLARPVPAFPSGRPPPALLVSPALRPPRAWNGGPA